MKPKKGIRTKPCADCGVMIEYKCENKLCCKRCAQKRIKESQDRFEKGNRKTRQECYMRTGWDEIWDNFKARRTSEQLKEVWKIAEAV